MGNVKTAVTRVILMFFRLAVTADVVAEEVTRKDSLAVATNLQS